MAKQTFTVGQVLTAAQLTSLQQTAMGGGAASAKSASYTLVSADAGTTISMTSTSATTITVNTGLFAAGDTVFIQNLGSGNCTVTAGTATVSTAGSAILPTNDAGILYFVSTGVAIFYDFIQTGAVSPLTTKGDLYGFSTLDARIPIGANGTLLTADSSESLGLKWAAPAGGAGLTLVKTQTIGSGVTSVTVTGAFSATYDNYEIIISGGVASADCGLELQLGSTTSGYYTAGFYNYASSSTLVGNSSNNGNFFNLFGQGTTNSLNAVGQLQAPNLAKFTSAQYASISTATGNSLAGRALGFEASTTQHTAFTIIVGSSANITGGTIKVYGYANS